ncbi:MAG TPA: SCO1664 family protein [Levilinea sp.]|nr:SCO1664 family protein [Levilinea sp.]
MSTIQDKDAILEALQKGEIDLQGQFLHGSNYTLLGDLRYNDRSMGIVYKPARGEQPLWDFPLGSLVKREVAAYHVSEELGWDLVPPTVYRKRNAPLGPGSLQLFIEHDPEYHYFRFCEEDMQRLRPVALFDCLVNNADRKGGHIIYDTNRRLWLIDHGICFHHDFKLRTVVWDFAGEPIAEDLLGDVRRFVDELAAKGKLYDCLSGLLLPGEILAMIDRGRRLIEIKVFPGPSGNRRPYPWPAI